MNIIITIVIGTLAGFIGGFVVKGSGFGILINFFLGLAGSFLGSFLFHYFEISIIHGLFDDLVSAISGAVIIIIIVNFFKK